MKNKIILLIVFSIGFISCNMQSDDTRMKATESIKVYFDDFYFEKNIKIDFVEIRVNRIEDISLDSVHQLKLKSKLLEIASHSTNINTIREAGKTKEFSDYADELNETFGDGLGFNVDAYLKFSLTDLNSHQKQNQILKNCYFVIDKDFNVLDASQTDFKKLIQMEAKVK
ncbi:hypothetical protein [Flavobacterium sp.]|uniref:hypothetical protein n=1 Tax=Flavobacterium sp. TaxID=239 RepID=UPI002FDD6B37